MKGPLITLLTSIVSIIVQSCLLFIVTTELVSLWEASARTLVVLDVDGWKYQFDVKNSHTP